MENILIVGINGFLGSHLAKKLKSEFNIIGIEKSNNQFRIKDEKFCVYNYDNINIEEIFKKHNFFAVINAATIYTVKIEDLDLLFNTNILFPIKLLVLSQRYYVKYFINTDTFFNSKKNLSYNYLSEYILSKKHLIEWLNIINKTCCLVNMKIFHMYGPNDNDNKFVMEIFKKLISDVNVIDLTKGEQKRDFIYIEDVVSAFLNVMKSDIYKKGNFFEFEVGYGEAISIKDFVSEMKNTLKSKTRLNFGSLEYRENEIMFSKSKNTKLKKLGWKPFYDYKKGIKRLIEFYYGN